MHADLASRCSTKVISFVDERQSSARLSIRLDFKRANIELLCTLTSYSEQDTLYEVRSTKCIQLYASVSLRHSMTNLDALHHFIATQTLISQVDSVDS
jgi:hypothetical protein